MLPILYGKNLPTKDHPNSDKHDTYNMLAVSRFFILHKKCLHIKIKTFLFKTEYYAQWKY